MTVIQKIIHFNPSRLYLKRFAESASNRLLPNSWVLDAGSGEGYYQEFFTKHQYHPTDLQTVAKPYGHLAFICDLRHIPVKTNCYDMVLCTQVLEHISEPEEVIREFHRVLKVEGQFWFSVPLFFQEHEVPYDYFRYTQYGLKYLLSKAGFQTIRIEWLEGYFATLSYQDRLAAQNLLSLGLVKENPLFWLIFGLPLWFCGCMFYVLSIIFGFLETMNKITSKGMCKNYCGVAQKNTNN